MEQKHIMCEIDRLSKTLQKTALHIDNSKDDGN